MSAIRWAFVACLVLCASQGLAQSSDGFVPVTDAELQDPDPADWLMWRRTLDGWGFRRLCSITDWKQVACGVLEDLFPSLHPPYRTGCPRTRIPLPGRWSGGGRWTVERWSGGAVERWRLDTTKTGLWMSRPRSWILS